MSDAGLYRSGLHFARWGGKDKSKKTKEKRGPRPFSLFTFVFYLLSFKA
jgi:hypothetical protein